MTQTSRGGKRAAVGQGIYRGKRANGGEIWGERRATRRGAQLEPRGKLRDLGGSGWGPRCGPSCWNTVEVKCLRNMKRSSTGEQTLCRILRRNISSGSPPCPFITRLLHRVLKREHGPLHTRQGGGDSSGDGTMGTSDTLRLLVLFVLGVLTYLIPFNSHRGV